MLWRWRSGNGKALEGEGGKAGRGSAHIVGSGRQVRDVKSPTLEACTVAVKPVAMLVAVIVAFGMAEPLLSTTVPAISPLVAWLHAVRLPPRATASMLIARTRFLNRKEALNSSASLNFGGR